MALIELIILALTIALVIGAAFGLYRAATRPAADELVSPADVEPADDLPEPETSDPSPVELL